MWGAVEAADDPKPTALQEPFDGLLQGGRVRSHAVEGHPPPESIRKTGFESDPASSPTDKTNLVSSLFSGGPQRLSACNDRCPEQHAIFGQELPLQRERRKPVVFLPDPRHRVEETEGG